MSGRHARSGAPRRSAVLLTLATVLGVWFGISAPEVSPVSGAPAPVAATVQPATPAVVPAQPERPARGDGR